MLNDNHRRNNKRNCTQSERSFHLVFESTTRKLKHHQNTRRPEHHQNTKVFWFSGGVLVVFWCSSSVLVVLYCSVGVLVFRILENHQNTIRTSEHQNISSHSLNRSDNTHILSLCPKLHPLVLCSARDKNMLLYYLIIYLLDPPG